MIFRKGITLLLIGLLSMFTLVPVFADSSESMEVMNNELTQEAIPKSIKIVPQALNLKVGKAKDIRVIAQFDKKGSENVSDAVLTVSDDKVLSISGMTVTALKKGEAKLMATYRGVSDEVHVKVDGSSKDSQNSTYHFQYDLPETIGAGQYLQVPVTLETEESGENGYQDVHISFGKVEGPGDILFRAEDSSGMIQSFLNQGEWMKSGFDLPAQYRQTDVWTLKFSKTGTYTFVYRIVKSDGTVIAESSQVVEVTPQLEDLGVQIANLTIMTGAFGKDQDGRDVGYTVIVGEPGQFAIVDVETEKVVRTIDLPEVTGSWTIVTTEDGTAYIGSYPNGHLYKYTPGADQLEDLGQPVAGTTVIYGLIPGKDGKIYGGTYPGGNLFQYDPAGGITDFGKMKPGEQYVRSVAYDEEREVLYAGVGAHATLIEYDLATGTKRNLLPEAYAKYSFVYDLNLIGGKLFTRLDPESKMVVIDAATGKVDAEFTAHSRSVIADPTRNVAYYTNGIYLYEYNLDTKISSQVIIGGHPAELGQTAIGWSFVHLNDTDYPGPTLFGFIGNYEGKAFKYNLQTQKLKVFTLPLPEQPTDIFNVATGPDGNIYSNGYISGGVGIFSPDTRTLVKKTGIGQSESMWSMGNKMYFGVYPDAKVFEYDLSKPWKSKQNPRQLFTMAEESQNRPLAMVGSEEHQKLFIGTSPQYGKLGGAFAIYDIASGQADIRRNLIPDQSVTSLVYKDGKIYGGSSIYGESTDPVAKEAKLFVWDISEGRVTYETVPVPGATAIGALLVGPEGNIWGLDQGTLFIFDPEKQEVIYQEDKFPGLRYSRGGVALVLGKDGEIYGTAQGKLFRADPDSKEITILRDQDSHRLTQDEYGNLYFKNGSSASYGNTLWRYTFEDRTISVTSVQLDQKELNLRAGESVVLQPEIAPVIATNKTVTWESDNIAVAAVDGSGQVKAMSPGTATIMVTTQDGGLIATCKVHVE
ncbi:Ig-like domain-containing protein [Paenibacillus dakarensis]|uniref:Ig-like domain-containing protein n=1 Tax=Paenibacillus dakarensis TaxID=1527293 RepID=UPI0006D588FA|nr:Ig-like domain-containing protein [Paenibacillus dakarensis]